MPYAPGPYPPPVAPPPPSGGGGNRKVVAIVAGIAAGLLVLCGGAVAAGLIVAQRIKPPQPPAPTASSSQDPIGPVAAGPIQWVPMEQGGTPLDSMWSELADEFAMATDLEVELEPVESTVFPTIMATRIAAGDVPDLYYSSGGARLRQQVEQGLVRDLTDDLADVIATIPPALVQPYTVDGRVYGLPYHAGGIGFWYNKALFAQAGLDPERPPRTWSDYLAVVNALKQANITPVALAGFDGWTSSFWYGCLAFRVAGVDEFKEAVEQRSLSENPDFLRAAQLLAEFVATQPFQPGFDSATYAGANGHAALVGTGQAAMELMGGWAPALYEVEVPGGLGDDLGWFPFPAVEGGKGSASDVYGDSGGFVVSADAPDGTVELLRFLHDEENYGRIIAADDSMIPVYQGFESTEGPDRTPLIQAIHEATVFQPVLDAEMPASAVGDLFRASQQLVLGKMTPEQALVQITDGWQAARD